MDYVTTPVRPALELLVDPVILVPGVTVTLSNPLVYANASELGNAAFRRWLFLINAARDEHHSPIRIGRYGADCFVDGSGPFHILSGGALVGEHVAPSFKEPILASNYNYLVGQTGRAAAVQAPCLMACHPGSLVWGHWLIDTLPKIILTERAFAGKFLYVVPEGTTDPASTNFFVRAVRDSLAAYGIAQDRLLRLRPGVVYRFSALHDVIYDRSPGLHPGALAALRHLPQPPPSRGRHALTVSMRSDADTRAVANRGDLDRMLRAHRAATLDPRSASFLDQVAAFRDSDVLVGDLGSNLAASVYCRPDAAIVTFAPAGWHDGYFADIFRRVGVRHADVRGRSRAAHAQDIERAPHDVAPEHLEAGLQATAVSHPPASVPLTVDGRPIARAIGPILHRIDFAEGGNARAFQRRGFYAPEGKHSWGASPSCQLLIPAFSAPAEDIWLEIIGIGYVSPPQFPAREMVVCVNDQTLAAFDIDRETHVHVLVPRALHGRLPDLSMTFHFPGALVSPQTFGERDTRPLGFMFETVALRRLV